MVAAVTLEFVMPYPPSVNHYWAPTGRPGRLRLSPAGRAYRISVWEHLRRQNVPRDQVEDHLSITVRVYPPDKRRRDLDNLTKATLDSLKHCGVIFDDCQFDLITLERAEPIEGGKLKVTIQTLRGPDDPG